MNKLEFKAKPRIAGEVTVVTVDRKEIESGGIKHGELYKVTMELIEKKTEKEEE